MAKKTKRGKRGSGLDPDFTPAGKFPVPIDPADDSTFFKNRSSVGFTLNKKQRKEREEKARRSKERFAKRENRRREALVDALEDNYGFNDSVKAKVDLDDRKEMRGGGAATRGTKFSSRSN